MKRRKLYKIYKEREKGMEENEVKERKKARR